MIGVFKNNQKKIDTEKNWKIFGSSPLFENQHQTHYWSGPNE